MLPDIKKPVVGLVVLFFIVIPDSSPVEGERRVHAKTKQVIPRGKNMIKFPDSLHEHLFKWCHP